MLIKSKQDIKNILDNGRRMGEILEKLEALCRPGISSGEIDAEAEKMIIKAGGRPAFKGYKTSAADRPFPATICASFNDEIVHGIPRKDRILKSGDIFSIDIGMLWRKVFTDTAVTVVVGSVSKEIYKLLDVTRQSLEEGIKAAQPGNSVAAIGKAVENYVKSQGKYGIVRDLVGHGVGHQVHEDPHIPNYYDPGLESIILKPGMVIAIEPMISVGGWQVETMDDGWTIRMKDRSMCAHFEHTVIITEPGNIVATRRPHEDA
ncbi:MAG: type I methionyl aminopeptidase [Candidatus Magasanikbacteria bacterium]|nr:type I methionyl aminopeptidase [Candidatus Magasanikbacteria bacterium]